MRMLYKYPQVEYPYARLLEENRRRGRADREFELIDALGEALAAGRYFDVFVEYAKADAGRHPLPDHGLQPRSRAGRAAHPAADLVSQHLVVGLSAPSGPCSRPTGATVVRTTHRHLGERWWYLDDRAARAGAAVHRERDQLRAALRRAERRPVRQGRLSRGGRRRPCRPGQSRPAGLEGGGPLPRDGRAGRIARRSEPGSPMRRSTIRSATSTRSSSGGWPRPMSSTGRFSRRASDDDQRRVQRQAYAGLALDQAVLSLQRRALARRRPGRSGAAGRAAPGPQRRAGGTSTTSTS